MPELWRQPFASTPSLHQRMSRQRREGTAPEMALRREMHALGLRYRLHQAPLIGLRRKADVVFTRARLAVFVDGCFWHGCPVHGQRSHEVNAWYWPEKITRNQARDRDTDRALRASGWRVVRVWEHDLTDQASARDVARAIAELVRSPPPRLNQSFRGIKTGGR